MSKNQNYGSGKWAAQVGCGMLLMMVGTVAYILPSNNAKNRLEKRLVEKVEIVADSDSDGLSIKEMSEVYSNLGLNPMHELRMRGFNLSIEEMQQYLRNIDKFNSLTDENIFSDYIGLQQSSGNYIRQTQSNR